MTDPSTWNGSVADPETTAHGLTVTQVIRLPELVEFRADKRVRKKLFEGAQLWRELLCYEAGPQFFPSRVLSYRHRLWPNELLSGTKSFEI